MAVSKEDLLINIEASTKGAQKNIEGLNTTLDKLSATQKKSQDQQSSFIKSFDALKGAVIGAVGAYYAVIKPLQMFIDEYKNAADESQKLINILRLTGDNVLESSKRFEEFAENMQKTVGVSGGLTQTLITQAKAAGLSNDQAEQAVIAAANLAETYGEDVAQSFNRVINAYEGNRTALGPLSSLVADLTKEQIQAGEHVNRLNRALNGLAKEGMKTFSGQAKSFSNATDDLSESLGAIIVKSFGLQDATGDIAKKMEYLNIWIKRNSESFIEFGRNLKFIVDGVFNTFSAGIFKVIQGLSKLASFAGMKDISKTFGDAADSSWEAAFNFEKLADSTSEVTKNTASLGKTINKTAPGFEEASKAVDELIKKSRELQNSSELVGKSEIETARLKAVADLNELGLLEDKVNKNKAAMAASSEARTAIVAQFAALKDASILKELDEIEKKNQQIAAQNEAFGMNTTERLNKELDLQLDLIEAQRQRLILEGKYSEAIEASLIRQEALLKKRTGQRIGAESSPTEKAVQSLGDMGSSLKTMFGSAFSDSISSLSGALGDSFKGIGSNISGYISSALGDSLSGVMSGIGDAIAQFASSTMSMISSIATFILQLPAIIGAANDMLKALLNFPADLLSSLSELFTTILQVLTVSFAKTLYELPGKLLKMLTDFVPKLANALINVIAELPDIMIKFLDSLPKMVGGLVTALAENAPRIIKSLIDALIKKGPALFASLARFAPKIAFAIAKALWDALYGLITGNMPELEISIDTKALSDTFKKMGDSLTGSASRVFAVSNLTEQQTGPAEKLKALADNVNKGFKDGASWLGKVWQHWIDVLVSSWRGIIAGLVNLWHGVIDFLNGVISAFKDMFAAVGELLMGVVMGFREMWLFVYSSVIMPLINGVMSAFSWVVNNVVNPLINFAANLAASIGDVGKKLAESFVSGLSGLVDIFRQLGEALVEPIKNLGGGGGGGSFVDKAKKALGLSDGGIIPGNAKAFGDSPRNDFIPAMLSPGEAVIPRSAMQDPAIAETVRGILSNRSLPSFSDGLMPRLASGGGNTEINLGGVVVNTSQSVDADFVRSRLMPTIRNELRRASLDGQTVIYKTGVR